MTKLNGKIKIRIGYEEDTIHNGNLLGFPVGRPDGLFE